LTKDSNSYGSRPIFKVFVSHRSTDRAFAKQLATDLRQRSIYAWLDEWDMPPGEPLTDAMERGIRECDVMLLLLSPSSVSSVRTGKGGFAFEVHIGEDRRFEERNFRMFGVLVEQCDVPSKLRNRLGRWLDFTDHKVYAERVHELVCWIIGDAVGPPITSAATGHTEYDLVTPAITWLQERYAKREWRIPLANLTSTNLTIADTIHGAMKGSPNPYGPMGESTRFPWGVALPIRPHIFGSLHLPKTKMYGSVVAMSYPGPLTEYDIIRAHYFISASAAYAGLVFWDMNNGFTEDGYRTLMAYGRPYHGLGDLGRDEPKLIDYVMYSRRHQKFMDDLEGSFVTRMTLL
jgi:hypothetical protein